MSLLRKRLPISSSLTRYLLPYRFSIGLFCNFALQLPFYGINCIQSMQTRHFFSFDSIAENGIIGSVRSTLCTHSSISQFLRFYNATCATNKQTIQHDTWFQGKTSFSCKYTNALGKPVFSEVDEFSENFKNGLCPPSPPAPFSGKNAAICFALQLGRSFTI